MPPSAKFNTPLCHQLQSFVAKGNHQIGNFAVGEIKNVQ
jgi:hypothetical protein